MTTIGMGVMILGGLIFAIGWSGSPKKTKLLGCGALLVAAGMCIGIGGNPAKDMPNGSPALVGLGFLLLIFFGYMAGIASKLVSESYMADFAQKWYVLFFYCLNLLMVGANICIHLRNVHLDKMREETK